ncbi:hypothetical protein EUX98_g9787, partial [Antrodiella citrinella]
PRLEETRDVGSQSSKSRGSIRGGPHINGPSSNSEAHTVDEDTEEFILLNDVDEKLIAEGCQNATIASTASFIMGLIHGFHSHSYLQSIFMAILDATILQYVQSAFNGRPELKFDKAVSVCLYLSLIMSISATLSYSYLTSRGIRIDRQPTPSAKTLRMAKRRLAHKYKLWLFSAPNRNLSAYFLYAAIILYLSDNVAAVVSIPVTVVFCLESLFIIHAQLGLMDDSDLGEFMKALFNKDADEAVEASNAA